MKKRYLYSLLFAVPGFFVSLVIAFVVFGAAAGFFWLFVFGDNTWPKASGNILTILLFVSFLVSWIASIFAGFVTGKKLEAEPDINRQHLLASVALTIVPIVFMVFYQYKVGNLGTKPAIVLCNEFCLEQGFPACEMPPEISGEKSCVCLDDSRTEVLRVPFASITP
jgi:hypothetical protein